MTLFWQLIWGSAFLGICAVLHVFAIGYYASIFSKLGKGFNSKHPFAKLVTLVGLAFILITLSHTVQVWIWAKAFLAMGVIDDLNTSLYFALTTYSTVGYGDVILGPGTRIFGVFAGVSGVLSLGVSTAFLVALLGRLLPEINGQPSGPHDH